MRGHKNYFLKKAPFLKLLFSLVPGIITERYVGSPSPSIYITILLSAFAGLIVFSALPVATRYRKRHFSGILSFLLVFSIGAVITHYRNIEHDIKWFGQSYRLSEPVVVCLQEDPVEKVRSFKSLATLRYRVSNKEPLYSTGRLILYFQKEGVPPPARGSEIGIRKALQSIKNTGNPGGFDYKQYCLSKGITHQVYLKNGDFVILGKEKRPGLTNFLVQSRKWVLSVLRTYIKEENALGLAEALLIGYKDDLNPALVQSYSNTGVVHIIAISGLHLGLIYWLLSWCLKPLRKTARGSMIRTVLVVSGLWLFALLAGAQPSILRSALMFSCIVAGESLSRKTSVFNSLALSAFILLCIQPHWLWDVGFQLSYAAVLSIIIFMKPVYDLLYVRNKLLDLVWKMNAVTLAAQVLTLPITIFYFHQFPNFFLLTNFIAVPLSSVILLGEIFLCMVYFLPVVCIPLGKALAAMISWMNHFVESVDNIPGAVSAGLYINPAQVFLLTVFIALLSFGLMNRSKPVFLISLLVFLVFATIRLSSFVRCQKQQKIIVYHIPGGSAIDFIHGRSYASVMDPVVAKDKASQRFNLDPSRLIHRVRPGSIPVVKMSQNYLQFNDLLILWLNRAMRFAGGQYPTTVDLLVLSKNANREPGEMMTLLKVGQVVSDGSVPTWLANRWKNYCDSMKIPFHNVKTGGAFVKDMR